jgi:Spy/CpxP family protein refolding chaperone
MLSRTRNRLALVSAVLLGSGALAVGAAVYGADLAGAHNHHHHHGHHHHHHHGIPQHNGGDHDADNNGGPSDGDGNI